MTPTCPVSTRALIALLRPRIPSRPARVGIRISTPTVKEKHQRSGCPARIYLKVRTGGFIHHQEDHCLRLSSDGLRNLLASSFPLCLTSVLPHLQRARPLLPRLPRSHDRRGQSMFTTDPHLTSSRSSLRSSYSHIPRPLRPLSTRRSAIDDGSGVDCCLYSRQSAQCSFASLVNTVCPARRVLDCTWYIPPRL